MTWRVARFTAADWQACEVRAAQAGELAWDGGVDADALAAAGRAFTLRDGAGRVVFCGGAIERHAGYATLWGLFGVHCPRVPLFLTRAARHFVAELPHRRVDAMVDARNCGALGWARLIGLKAEAVLRDATIDGADMVIVKRENG